MITMFITEYDRQNIYPEISMRSRTCTLLENKIKRDKANFAERQLTAIFVQTSINYFQG